MAVVPGPAISMRATIPKRLFLPVITVSFSTKQRRGEQKAVCRAGEYGHSKRPSQARQAFFGYLPVCLAGGQAAD